MLLATQHFHFIVIHHLLVYDIKHLYLKIVQIQPGSRVYNPIEIKRWKTVSALLMGKEADCNVYEDNLERDLICVFT